MSTPSRAVYRGRALAIGRFRCRPGDPAFRDSGPARGHLLVFPREPVAIRHAGKREVLADPTSVMLYNAGQAYTRRAHVPAGDRCEWFAFDGAAVLEARRAAGARDGDLERPFADLVRAPADAPSYLLARRAYAHARGGDVDETWLAEACGALLDHVVRRAAGTPPSAPSPAHVALAEGARALLARRLGEPLSLDTLATELGVSPFHLARVFRAVTGTTIHRHRTELRVRAGLERLADGVELAAVACELGFATHSHFTQAFRARFGVPPSAARKILTAPRR